MLCAITCYFYVQTESGCSKSIKFVSVKKLTGTRLFLFWNEMSIMCDQLINKSYLQSKVTHATISLQLSWIMNGSPRPCYTPLWADRCHQLEPFICWTVFSYFVDTGAKSSAISICTTVLEQYTHCTKSVWKKAQFDVNTIYLKENNHLDIWWLFSNARLSNCNWA